MIIKELKYLLTKLKDIDSIITNKLSLQYKKQPLFMWSVQTTLHTNISFDIGQYEVKMWHP